MRSEVWKFLFHHNIMFTPIKRSQRIPSSFWSWCQRKFDVDVLFVLVSHLCWLSFFAWNRSKAARIANDIGHVYSVQQGLRCPSISIIIVYIYCHKVSYWRRVRSRSDKSTPWKSSYFLILMVFSTRWHPTASPFWQIWTSYLLELTLRSHMVMNLTSSLLRLVVNSNKVKISSATVSYCGMYMCRTYFDLYLACHFLSTESCSHSIAQAWDYPRPHSMHSSLGNRSIMSRRRNMCISSETKSDNRIHRNSLVLLCGWRWFVTVGWDHFQCRPIRAMSSI